MRDMQEAAFDLDEEFDLDLDAQVGLYLMHSSCADIIMCRGLIWMVMMTTCYKETEHHSYRLFNQKLFCSQY